MRKFASGNITPLSTPLITISFKFVLRKIMFKNDHPFRKYGPFEVLYMEDTPMLVDYISQIGVMLVIVDEMVIPGKLVKPILENIFSHMYKVR
jgi:hypothetical protein